MQGTACWSIKKAILSPPDPQRGTPFTKRYSKEDTTVSSSRFTHCRCRRWTRQRIHTSRHTAKEWLLREVLHLSRRGASCCPVGSSDLLQATHENGYNLHLLLKPAYAREDLAEIERADDKTLTTH